MRTRTAGPVASGHGGAARGRAMTTLASCRAWSVEACLRLLLCLTAATALVTLPSCGSGSTAGQSTRRPPARPAAVNKLAQGVAAATAPAGKERAIDLFEAALVADRELWEARYNLGVLRAEAGDWERADRELTRAQQLAPDAEDVAVALSEVRRRRRDHAGAIAALEGFVQRHPDARVAPLALLTALREGAQLERAIELAHRILIRDSKNSDARAELALAHLARGEVETAQILAKQAQQNEPASAIVERTLGLIALSTGDDALAFRHFTRASELDPSDTIARLNIATVLLQAGVYERALANFQAVLDIASDDTSALLGLAACRRALTAKGDKAGLSEVERLLQAVLEREPNHAAATYNLAVLYAHSLDRPAEAASLFQRFLASAPATHPARATAEKYLSTRR